MYGTVESWCCIAETNTALYVFLKRIYFIMTTAIHLAKMDLNELIFFLDILSLEPGYLGV